MAKPAKVQAAMAVYLATTEAYQEWRIINLPHQQRGKELMKALRILGYARRLFWFLELLISPTEAAEALLEQPRVKRWLEKQPEEDQRKIREAAPLVIGAILAALD